MNNDIKPGDLVMVVKPTPCCGATFSLGKLFVARETETKDAVCIGCGHRFDTHFRVLAHDGWRDGRRLKKIDPPAEGDSLPTRADLDIPVAA